MKRNESVRHHRGASTGLAEPGNSRRRPSEAAPAPSRPAKRPGAAQVSTAAGGVHPLRVAPAAAPAASALPASERQAPKKPESAKNYKTAPRSYRFQRGRTRGIVEVLDENSYVMAEYSERTGSVQWQRVVLASQREQIERWLEEHYPRA